ncbi:MAG: hypothetical protein MRY79_02930 [Alphaproteobacteria bacterium]|nr:hypothetical protein [Alphaproteobacteria bacterium]
MTQIAVSYRSVEVNVTSLQVAEQRQRFDLRVGQKPEPSNILNNQERQIFDDVGISDAALEKLEEAKKLAEQLQDYLDYLKGRGRENSVKITPPQGEPSDVIAKRSTRLAASVTVGSITEKTLEISAEFDEAGKLSELSVSKSETTVEFVRAELTLEQRGFFAVV